MTHATKAIRYARAVLDGKKPSCKWERLACRRFIDDLKRAKDRACPYRFDEKQAGRVCAFIEKLPHVKGKWAAGGQTITLEEWQCFIVCNIFGWLKKSNGMRRFKKASIYVPRKNGKSVFAAGISLWMFSKDGEHGAEVYSGATSEKQAWEVFRPSRLMVEKTPALKDGLGITVNAKSLIRIDDGSRFEPVIGNPGDGASPSCAIVDEYHEHPTSSLHDTMETGMGARDQPLLLVISTAGDNLAGPCKEDWDKVCSILDNIDGFEDDSHFGIIYTIDEGDDWTNKDSLKKANPNWGVSVNPDIYLRDQRNAIVDPRKQAAFKTKHLNQWVTAKHGFFNTELWARCKDDSITPDDFEDCECFAGADLSSKGDLTTLPYIFKRDDIYYVFAKHYLPRATVDKPENQHYRAWEAGEWLTVTDGNMTDIRAAIDDAKDLAARFNLVRLAFDGSRAHGVSPIMIDEGLPLEETPCSSKFLSEPMRFLDALINAGRIRHNGDPVLAWAISNVVGVENRAGQVYPNKPPHQPSKKIDPVVAMLLALRHAMVGAGNQNSVGVSLL